MNPLENAIAKAVQTGVPFVSDPWREIGRSLAIPADQVLAQLRAWRDAGTLREISAVLEGSVMGYESALCTARVGSRIDEVAAVLNAHPTITHNYVRDHAYDLWFTIAMPEEIGVDAALDALARATSVEKFHALRRTHTFKIGVRFDLETLESSTNAGMVTEGPRQVFDARERALLRALQSPLPYEERPFGFLAARVGYDEDELLAFARANLGGPIRRYVATFRHRKLGVKGNGMVVWNVPDARLVDVGKELANAPEVSHCYARTPIEGFPYPLYSMIHGPDVDAVHATARALSQRVGVDDYRVLVSTRELKKARLRYFLPELDAWWAAHRPKEAA